MPALRGILASDPCEFTATLGSESVTISFDRAKMTLRGERELTRAAEANDIDAMVAWLERILIGWDVVDEQGQPVLLTAEVLLDLPSAVLGALITRMGEAATPSDAEGNASSEALSSQVAGYSEQVQMSPNGPVASPSPAPSASPSPT